MMNILKQGENFFHALLPELEQGVTHLLAKSGDVVFLHKLLQSGEIVSQELNIPAMRSILTAIDTIVPQQQ